MDDANLELLAAANAVTDALPPEAVADFLAWAEAVWDAAT